MINELLINPDFSSGLDNWDNKEVSIIERENRNMAHLISSSFLSQIIERTIHINYKLVCSYIPYMENVESFEIQISIQKFNSPPDNIFTPLSKQNPTLSSYNYFNPRSKVDATKEDITDTEQSFDFSISVVFTRIEFNFNASSDDIEKMKLLIFSKDKYDNNNQVFINHIGLVENFDRGHVNEISQELITDNNQMFFASINTIRVVKVFLALNQDLSLDNNITLEVVRERKISEKDDEDGENNEDNGKSQEEVEEIITHLEFEANKGYKKNEFLQFNNLNADLEFGDVLRLVIDDEYKDIFVNSKIITEWTYNQRSRNDGYVEKNNQEGGEKDESMDK